MTLVFFFPPMDTISNESIRKHSDKDLNVVKKLLSVPINDKKQDTVTIMSQKMLRLNHYKFMNIDEVIFLTKSKLKPIGLGTCDKYISII